MKTLIDNELVKDEVVQWQGQPQTKVFHTKDILLIPISIIWSGFVVLWELSVLSTGFPSLFKLWGIPFLLIGIYITIGRFFYKHYLNKNTYYIITNKRVIIVKELIKVKITDLYIANQPAIERKVRRNGTGNIAFGSYPPFTEIYVNSGLDFLMYKYRWFSDNTIPLAMYDLEDIDDVYKLICLNKELNE